MFLFVIRISGDEDAEETVESCRSEEQLDLSQDGGIMTVTLWIWWFVRLKSILDDEVNDVWRFLRI